MKKLQTGQISLWLYQGGFYKGGDLIVDVSNTFLFQVIDNKIILTGGE